MSYLKSEFDDLSKDEQLNFLIKTLIKTLVDNGMKEEDAKKMIESGLAEGISSDKFLESFESLIELKK